MNSLGWILFSVHVGLFLILGFINPVFDKANLSFRRWINRTRKPFWRPLMILTHRYNDILAFSIQLTLLGLVIGIVFQDWYRATILIGALFIQTAVVGISKRLTAVERPPQMATQIFMTSGSYPSGHSSASLSMALLLPLILRPYLPGFAVTILFICLMLIALLTAYGRLYLDVHWLTDILGGWFLAIAVYLLTRILL